MQTTKSHVALLASPGLGHLIPVLELGKRLVTHHKFYVTIFVVATDASNEQFSYLLHSQDHQKLINIVLLPYVDISSLVDPNASIVSKILIMMREALPSLRSIISTMKFRPTALIVDLFGTEALKVADEFGMLKYIFIASNALFLSTIVYAPALDKHELDDHIHRHQPLKIPGCTPIQFEDTPEAFLYPNDPMFTWFLRLGTECTRVDGLLVNTWEDLESQTLSSLKDSKLLGRVAKAPVYPIGPLIRPVEVLEPAGNEVLAWLDMQPDESVIFVSFGSGGTLSTKQMIELAWGLELSQQRFIWVVRPPTDNYLTSTRNDFASIVSDYLPERFLSRTHNVGLVVPMWAPQAEILAHSSVGAFLSHCGWNSTIESVVNGVPIIAWPLYAEQKLNAMMLTQKLEVAVRSEGRGNGFSESLVEREEIKMMITKIMVDKQGNAMRKKVRELKYSAKKALSEGGLSHGSLSQLAKECESSFEWLKVKAQGG